MEADVVQGASFWYGVFFTLLVVGFGYFIYTKKIKNKKPPGTMGSAGADRKLPR